MKIEYVFREFRRIAKENYDIDSGLTCDVFDLIDEVERNIKREND